MCINVENDFLFDLAMSRDLMEIRTNNNQGERREVDRKRRKEEKE